MMPTSEPSPEELFQIFQGFPYRSNPFDAPLVRALREGGYSVMEHPIFPEYTSQDWLAAKVHWLSLEVILRQPTPDDILLCRIQRIGSRRSMTSPLLDLARLLLFARQNLPALRYVGGCTSKRKESDPGELAIPRLFSFYTDILGDLQRYDHNWQIWLFGDARREERYSRWVWRRAARYEVPPRRATPC